jgi:hypothetical protein
MILQDAVAAFLDHHDLAHATRPDRSVLERVPGRDAQPPVPS